MMSGANGLGAPTKLLKFPTPARPSRLSNQNLRLILVYQYALLNVRDLSKLRQDVHNILDWIVEERLQWLKGIMGRYARGEAVAAGFPGPSTGPGGISKWKLIG